MTLAERMQVFELQRLAVCRPRTSWRTMCADNGDLSVIGIPGHLLKRWWSLAERR